MTVHYGAGSCPTCGKLRFLTRAQAKKTTRRMKGRRGRLHAYRCGDFWHIGHMPTAVTTGRLDRTQISPRPTSTKEAEHL